MYELNIAYSVSNFILFMVLFFTGGKDVTYDVNYESSKSKAVKAHLIKHVFFFLHHMSTVLIFPDDWYTDTNFLFFYFVIGAAFFVAALKAHRPGNDIDSGVLGHMVEPIVNIVQIVLAGYINYTPLFTFCNTWPYFSNIGAILIGGRSFIDWDRINLLSCPWNISTMAGVIFAIFPTWIFFNTLHPKFLKIDEFYMNLSITISSSIIILFTLFVGSFKFNGISIGSIMEFNKDSHQFE